MFLSPFMLVFAAAAVLPVVLHLLSRSRQTEVKWSAMMFLEEASPRRARMQKFREYLLLLLRSAAVLALALAMARPVTGGGAPLRPAGRAALVVIVDTSGSTGAPTGPGAVRLDQIRESVGRLLSSLGEEDVAALLVEDPAVPPLFTSERSAILARLSAIRPTATAMDLPASLERAAALLGAQGAPNRIIAVVTDRQLVTYEALDDAFANRWARLRDELGISRVLFLPSGDTDPDNVSVREIEVLDSPVLEGRSARLRVTVRNDGATPRPGFRIVVRLVGQPDGSAQVDLAAGSEGSAVVPMRFVGRGRAVVSAEIEPSGPTFDDRLLRVIDVGQPIRVLVVDPGAGSGGRSGLSALALAPLAAAGRSGDTIAVETAAEVPRFDLERFSVVVVPQLQSVSPEEARALRQYVYGGGGLVMGVGPLTHEATIDELGGLLSAEVGPPVPPGGATQRVELAQPGHPVARGLASASDVLPAASISRYRVLRPTGDAGVVLRLSPSVPLLVEGRFGRGKVLLSAVPLEGLWSDMTRSVGYVPLMQALVRYAALPPPDAVNLRLGETLQVPLRPGSDPASVRLDRPTGESVRLEPIQTTSGSVVRFGPVRTPGLYSLRYRLLEGDPATQAVAEEVYVRPSESESDLRSDDTRLAAAVERVGGVLLSPQEVTNSQGLRYGRELWLETLLAGIVLLAAEVILARAWRV